VKYVWDAGDIDGGVVVKCGESIELWMIGYDDRVKDPDRKWALVSLADGSIAQSSLSKIDLAMVLNASAATPQAKKINVHKVLMKS